MAAKKKTDETQVSIPGTEPTAEELAAARERKRNKPLGMADAVKRVLEVDRKAAERCAEVEKTMRANLDAAIEKAHGKINDKAKADAAALLARVPESERETAERVMRAAREAVVAPVAEEDPTT